MAVERFAQFGDLSRICERRHGRRYKGGDRALTGQRTVIEDTELVAEPYGFEGARGVEEVGVSGLVAVTAQLVEGIVDGRGQRADGREGTEAVDLACTRDPGTRTSDEFLGQDFTELACLDLCGIRIAENIQFRLRTVKGKERLMLVKNAEIR
ncbi:hypothetical protein AB0N79_11030 [Streptomyces microflavus]|uniref:hypothetical protein n=1 Tax=Streptomyces microflavus TaxID=1919 RepID=UPI00342517EB